MDEVVGQPVSRRNRTKMSKLIRRSYKIEYLYHLTTSKLWAKIPRLKKICQEVLEMEYGSDALAADEKFLGKEGKFLGKVIQFSKPPQRLRVI